MENNYLKVIIFYYYIAHTKYKTYKKRTNNKNAK